MSTTSRVIGCFGLIKLGPVNTYFAVRVAATDKMRSARRERVGMSRPIAKRLATQRWMKFALNPGCERT